LNIFHRAVPEGFKGEAGESPARGRHRNRGRNPQNATGETREGAGSRMIRKPGNPPVMEENHLSRAGKVEKFFGKEV